MIDSKKPLEELGKWGIDNRIVGVLVVMVDFCFFSFFLTSLIFPPLDRHVFRRTKNHSPTFRPPKRRQRVRQKGSAVLVNSQPPGVQGAMSNYSHTISSSQSISLAPAKFLLPRERSQKWPPRNPLLIPLASTCSYSKFNSPFARVLY